MVKPTTIRLVLSLADRHGWSLRQIDINNAFLQGHLGENVIVHQHVSLIKISLHMYADLGKLIIGKIGSMSMESRITNFLVHWF